MNPTGRGAPLLLLALLMLAALALSVSVGAVAVRPAELVRVLAGGGDPATAAIIRELRLPRTVQAGLIGGALAVSGATFQALLRNPLAEPYVLGVSGGAAVGAVAVTLLAGPARLPWLVPVAAFAGAAGAILLVLRIAASAGRVMDTRVLLLAGVVAGAFFNACILLALVFADAESFRSAIFWMMGSVSGAGWGGTALLALYALPVLALILSLARPLNLLALGDDTAAYLGVSLQRTKLLAYAGASMLAAAAVAAAGVIGFVGLVVPHAIRLLWGSDHQFLLPASALLGAAFLMLADALARTAAAPTEIPVGVITALIGVPFFVWLLRRRAA